MDILLKVLTITAPVFLLSTAGFMWVRLKYAFDLAFVTRLAIQFGMPCLIFNALVNADLRPDTVVTLATATLVGYSLVTVLSFVMLRMMGLGMRVYLAPIVFGNTGNLGLPLALFAFGTDGLAYALVIFTVMLLVNFTVGVWFVSGKGSREMFRQPMVYGALLGGLFMLLDVTPPLWIMNSVELAGQIAIPLMLLTLGVAIARLAAGDLLRAGFVSIMKLAIGLGAALAVIKGFAITDPVIAGALILQMIMPVAVTSYMIASQYDTSPEAVAGLVMGSTFLSVLAIPGVLAFLI